MRLKLRHTLVTSACLAYALPALSGTPPEKIDATNLFCSHIGVKVAYYDSPKRSCPSPGGAPGAGFCHEETDCTILPAKDRKEYADRWRKKPGRTPDDLKKSDQQIINSLTKAERDELVALFKSNQTYDKEDSAWFKSTLVCAAVRAGSGSNPPVCPPPQKCALDVYYAPETDVKVADPDPDNDKSFFPLREGSTSGAAK